MDGGHLRGIPTPSSPPHRGPGPSHGPITRVALNVDAWKRPRRVAVNGRRVRVGWFRHMDAHTIGGDQSGPGPRGLACGPAAGNHGSGGHCDGDGSRRGQQHRAGRHPQPPGSAARIPPPCPRSHSRSDPHLTCAREAHRGPAAWRRHGHRRVARRAWTGRGSGRFLSGQGPPPPHPVTTASRRQATSATVGRGGASRPSPASHASWCQHVDGDPHVAGLRRPRDGARSLNRRRYHRLIGGRGGRGGLPGWWWWGGGEGSSSRGSTRRRGRRRRRLPGVAPVGLGVREDRVRLGAGPMMSPHRRRPAGRSHRPGSGQLGLLDPATGRAG